ncbi:MAG: dTDP-4-dehydrorhamnose reductase, partial [Paramuribaculum sp.]|nr:dTDP-4-dehydrorhamnose reductase [Paramuribaculum sp.]
MRILVTGGNGQLGTCLKIAAEHSANEYIFTDVDDIDITDPQAVDLGVSCNNFDIIVNCAAYTNVDKAEEQTEFAEKLNAEAVGYLAEAAKKNGCTLIHISTDYVFGGNQGNTPRNETEPTNPTGVYGVTKLHGEQKIAESGCKAIIIRTAWLYSEFGKNFVKTMLNLTATKPELKVVIDQTGTPTYARDLANAIVDIIDNGKYVGNEG